MNHNRSHEENKWPNVAIVILNWKGWRDTLACLESIQKLQYPNYFTIVVDNGSKDDSAERIRHWLYVNANTDDLLIERSHCFAFDGRMQKKSREFASEKISARILFIMNEDNLGFADGNNVAIHYALAHCEPAEYLLLLNNDTKIDADCITQLFSVARKANADIVGALLRDYDNDHIQFSGLPRLRYPAITQFFQPIIRYFLPRADYTNEFSEYTWVAGTGMFLSSTVLQHIFSLTGRYLDGSLFLYYEDIEICLFAHTLGYRIVLARDAVVHHITSGSTSGLYSPIQYYYANRNWLLLAKRFMPKLWLTVFVPFSLSVCAARILKNMIYCRFSSARAIFSGLRDAVKGVTGKWRHHDASR
jgi:GT2 family glycosyltransferase